MKVSSFAVMITVEEGVLLLSQNFVQEKNLLLGSTALHLV